MVVVTGLGLITACGATVADTWKQLCAGSSGVSAIPYWNKTLYKTDLAGVCHEFDPKVKFTKKQLKRLDYSHLLAISAAEMAIKDAQLNSTVNKKKIGIFLGTSLAGMISGQAYHEQLLTGKRKTLGYAVNYPMQVLLDKLTEQFGFLGSRTIISTACTASTIAIAQAAEAIKSGQ